MIRTIIQFRRSSVAEGECMSEKTEHLNMIQNVISRVANNSLQIKCWGIAVTAAFAALSNDWIIFFASAPLVLFWALDSYYLSIERRYRELYDSARIKSVTDYSMKIEDYRPIVLKTAFSWSVLPFYSVLILTVIAIGLIRLWS